MKHQGRVSGKAMNLLLVALGKSFPGGTGEVAVAFLLAVPCSTAAVCGKEMAGDL